MHLLEGDLQAKEGKLEVGFKDQMSKPNTFNFGRNVLAQTLEE